MRTSMLSTVNSIVFTICRKLHKTYCMEKRNCNCICVQLYKSTRNDHGEQFIQVSQEHNATYSNLTFDIREFDTKNIKNK